MSFFDISFDFESTPEAVAADLYGFAGELDDLTECLAKIVREVAIPSIRQNFEVGGRPAWAPLELETVYIKGHADPLIATTKLFSHSTSLDSWSIGNHEATLNAAQITDYATFHQDGTRKMPARPFATLQPQDEDEAEEKLVQWIAEKLGEHNFAVFTASIGDGDF